MKHITLIITGIFFSCLSLFTHTSMVKVAVFCSADNKVDERFKIIAHNIGKELGTHNFCLITGGSKTGLMKEVIDGYISAASSVKNLYGVMPLVLAPYDVHHPAIIQENLKWAETLHMRLALFHALADIIIILPGGFGTLHELMDFLVHNQFALSKKPIVLINPAGFWNHLLAQFRIMVQQQLLSPTHLAILSIVSSEDECMQKLLINDFFVSDQGLNSFYWQVENNEFDQKF